MYLHLRLCGLNSNKNEYLIGFIGRQWKKKNLFDRTKSTIERFEFGFHDS